MFICSALIIASVAVNKGGIINVSLATDAQAERTRATVRARTRKYDWIDMQFRA